MDEKLLLEIRRRMGERLCVVCGKKLKDIRIKADKLTCSGQCEQKKKRIYNPFPFQTAAEVFGEESHRNSEKLDEARNKADKVIQDERSRNYVPDEFDAEGGFIDINDF